VASSVVGVVVLGRAVPVASEVKGESPRTLLTATLVEHVAVIGGEDLRVVA
jgi:hypothetical protein